MFRSLFPSFEKPDDCPRYVNIELERRSFRGVGIVLLLAVSCGVALALWEPSSQVTSPFVTASAQRSAPATVGAAVDTPAAVDSDDDDQATPTVKLSTLCSQRATARRDCANVKALKDARLTAPDPEPTPTKEAKPAVTAAKAPASVEPAAMPQTAVARVPETPAAVQAEVPAAPVPKTAQKAKRPRPAEEPPIERLVRVYDQVLPDGRRVPVYRRVGGGGLETGTIVDGEYRPARRANLDPPSGRTFGLQ